MGEASQCACIAYMWRMQSFSLLHRREFWRSRSVQLLPPLQAPNKLPPKKKNGRNLPLETHPKQTTRAEHMDATGKPFLCLNQGRPKKTWTQPLRPSGSPWPPVHPSLRPFGPSALRFASLRGSGPGLGAEVQVRAALHQRLGRLQAPRKGAARRFGGAGDPD